MEKRKGKECRRDPKKNKNASNSRRFVSSSTTPARPLFSLFLLFLRIERRVTPFYMNSIHNDSWLLHLL